MDTIVEPFAQILGRTTVGENCRIGACSIVQDSELADDVEVGQFTMIGTSRLERGAHAGPYARLRMENHVAAGAHIRFQVTAPRRGYVAVIGVDPKTATVYVPASAYDPSGAGLLPPRRYPVGPSCRRSARGIVQA